MRKLVVKDFPVTIVGNQGTGWRIANEAEKQTRTLLFDFEIEDSGGGCLLVYHSKPHELYADDWYESKETAIQVANDYFGIPIDTWEENFEI